MSSVQESLRLPIGIVAQGGEVDDRVKSAQIGGGQVAQVLLDGRHLAQIGNQAAFAEISGVQSHDFVAGGRQVRRHHRADESVVAGNQNAFYFTHDLELFEFCNQFADNFRQRVLV